jgi:hypothetical protein
MKQVRAAERSGMESRVYAAFGYVTKLVEHWPRKRKRGTPCVRLANPKPVENPREMKQFSKILIDYKSALPPGLNRDLSRSFA